jgi:hypothetical protein
MSKKFKDDFTLTTEIDDRGRSRQVSTYVGALFDLEINQTSLDHLKIMAALLYIIGLASHVGAGFLQHSASFQWFVSLPYVLAFLPIGLLGFALVRLPKDTQNLKRYQTEASFMRGRIMAIFAIGLIWLNAVGLAVFVLVNGGSLTSRPDYLYLFLEIFSSIMFLILFKKLIQVKIQEKMDHNAF